MRFSNIDKSHSAAAAPVPRLQIVAGGAPHGLSQGASSEKISSSRPKSPVVVLDLLRGLAALLVVLVHVRQTAFVDYTALPTGDRGIVTALFYGMTRSGNEAVLVFFVLSGLLVGGQVISRVTEQRFDWASYAVDRVSRIFLPLIPAVLISAAMGGLLFGHFPGFFAIIANSVGLNGVLTDTMIENRPLWSLAYEIWFYVIAGALAYIFSRGPNIWSVAFLAAGTFSMAVLDTRYFLFWGFGAMASLFGVLRKQEMLFGVGLVLLSIGAFLNQLTVPTKIFEYVPTRIGIDGASLLAVGLCLMLPLLCSERATRQLHFIQKPAAALASFSYSLYLFHFPINEVLQLWMPQAREISLTSVEFFVIRVALCILGSLFFYWCFERNTPKVRRALSRYFHLAARPA